MRLPDPAARNQPACRCVEMHRAVESGDIAAWSDVHILATSLVKFAIS